jgi:hypothetical protein
MSGVTECHGWSHYNRDRSQSTGVARHWLALGKTGTRALEWSRLNRLFVTQGQTTAKQYFKYTVHDIPGSASHCNAISVTYLTWKSEH